MINNLNSPTRQSPNAGSPPPNGPGHHLWIWITAIVAAVLLVVTITVFAFIRPGTSSTAQSSPQATATPSSTTPTVSTNTPTTTPSSTGGSSGSSGGSTGSSSSGATITVSQALGTVSLYYADINAKNYSSAYNRWGSHYRSSTSYQTFAQGFVTTQRDDLQLGPATGLADGTIKVPITVTSLVSSSGSSVVNTYQGYYIVGLESGQPRLLNANLQPINSEQDSVKRAVSLLQQYYADINARDYSDAYAIWGSAYQKSTSSYRFAHGFDDTRSVSININSGGVTLLNDGTVRVPLTITSVNTSGSGTVTQTYQGYYIVGMESGVWHLLSANIH